MMRGALDPCTAAFDSNGTGRKGFSCTKDDLNFGENGMIYDIPRCLNEQ